MTHTREQREDLTATRRQDGAQMARSSDQRLVPVRAQRRTLHATVVEVPVVRHAPVSHARRNVIIGAAVGGVVVLGAGVWAVIAIVTWVADHAVLLLGMLAVLAIGYGWAVKTTECPGLHCFGCNH